MNCNCLCQINHPEERGICTGKAEKIVIFTVPEDPISGQHDVTMCEPCSEATTLHKDRE